MSSQPVPDPVDPQTHESLRAVLAPLAEGSDLVEVVRLTGGMFATSYRVTFADGRRVVVKTAPTATERLLTYEHDLIRSEAEVYARVADRPDLLMPRALHTDFSRSVLPGDVLVANYLTGTPLTDLRTEGGLTPRDEQGLERELGGYMARLHTLTGERFGYVNAASGLVGETWPEAFGRIMEAMLHDAERWAIEVPAVQVRAALVRHHDALAQVTVPALVHTDLWAGNLFVDPGSRHLVGVIDPERALWGDPLLEFAGADQTGRGPVPEPLVAGYAAVAGDLPLGSPSGEIRLLLYRLYLALVLFVEVGPRGYTGEWVAGYRAASRANLEAALDALA